MIQKVIKRDSRVVNFDRNKIIVAIAKAGNEAGEFGTDTSKFIAGIVITELENEHDGIPFSIEIIQNKIERVLMQKGFYGTAKVFILYREHRRELRELKGHITSDLVENYLNQGTWEVHENANIDYSIQGLKAFIAGKAEEIYWLNKLYPKKIAALHKEGWVHIHNLSMLSAYCCGWDLEDLLRRGFGGAPGKPYSKPAKHLSSALGQMMNFLFTLQNEVAGAVAFSSFDTYLAPFVLFDKLPYEEVKQQIQEFIYNMNQTMRTGGQSPFSNLTLDIHPHLMLKDRPVIIGGEEHPEIRYGDLQREMNMINKAFWETMIEGDGNGRPFTFPIPTINIDKKFDWNNPELEPMWEATRKYGTPYFANFINSDLSPEDARSMCCRLRLDVKELRKKGGGLFGADPLTGSIGVITIDMPRIGYLSKTKEEFFGKVSEIMDAAKEGLMVKRKTIERFTEEGLYPYSKVYLKPIKESSGSYWGNHFSTIGIVGMNEALLNFMGVNMGTENGIRFTLELMKFMREKMQKFQEETGTLFNLEATPSESTSYSLALKDKKRYPGIIVGNEKEFEEYGADPFYTNSAQLPVDYTDDPFEVAEKQNDIQSLWTGGTVVHFFLGESLQSGNEAKLFVRKVLENYKLPYITLTPTFSVCPIHGYIPGEHEYCPYCDAELAEKYERGEKEEKSGGVKLNIDI